MADDDTLRAYHAAGHLIAARWLLPGEVEPLPVGEPVRQSLCERLDREAARIYGSERAEKWLVILAAGWMAESLIQEPAGEKDLRIGFHLAGEERPLSILHGPDCDTWEQMARAEETMMAADQEARELLQQQWPAVKAQAEAFLTDRDEWLCWQVALDSPRTPRSFD